MERENYNENLERRAIFTNLIENEDFIWFWAMNVNALFQFDKKSGAVTRLSEFIFAKNQVPPSYSNIIKYQQKLICVPQCADTIAIYDLETKSMHHIDMDLDIYNETSNIRGKYWGYVCKDEYIFFLGYWNSLILKFNMKTEQVEKIIDLYANIDKKENVVYFKQGIVDQDLLLIPSCLDNIVFEIDSITLNYRIQRIEGVERGFYTICREGDYIWLTPKQNDPIIKWKRDSDEIVRYNNYPKECDPGKDISFGLAVCYDGFLWAFPLRSDKVIKVNLENGDMELVHTINQYFASAAGPEFNYQTYFMLRTRENRICAYAAPHREMIEYDCKKDILTCHNYQISINDLNEYYVFIEFLNKPYMIEKDIVLNNYIEYLSNNNHIKTDIDENENAGKKIYDFINKLC